MLDNKMKELEKEMETLSKLVKMRLLSMEQLRAILIKLSKKYDTTVVWRNHNITNDTRTIEIF